VCYDAVRLHDNVRIIKEILQQTEGLLLFLFILFILEHVHHEISCNKYDQMCSQTNARILACINTIQFVYLASFIVQMSVWPLLGLQQFNLLMQFGVS
jgi:hypothetical protein